MPVETPPVLLLPDLSEFQPGADMAGIKASNGGAAIIRAAYGDAHPDQVFARLRAAAAGYRFLGLYQYIVAGQDITAQAGRSSSWPASSPRTRSRSSTWRKATVTSPAGPARGLPRSTVLSG